MESTWLVGSTTLFKHQNFLPPTGFSWDNVVKHNHCFSTLPTFRRYHHGFATGMNHRWICTLYVWRGSGSASADSWHYCSFSHFISGIWILVTYPMNLSASVALMDLNRNNSSIHATKVIDLHLNDLYQILNFWWKWLDIRVANIGTSNHNQLSLYIWHTSTLRHAH